MNFEFWIWLLVSFVFGGVIGSFLNVVILRLPEERSISGRSHCPSCKNVLRAIDLVPIFSYLFLGGRCRNCKTVISARYLVIELISAFCFAFAYYMIWPQSILDVIILFKIWFVVSVLISVFVIDLEHFLILDKIIFPASIIVLIFNIGVDLWGNFGFNSIFLSNTIGGVVGAVVTAGTCFAIWYVSKGKWIGFGDVKFMLFLGVVLGFPVSIMSFFLSFMLGAAIAIPMLVLGGYSFGSKLPLGTFLSASVFISLFWGTEILNWYLHLIGL